MPHRVALKAPNAWGFYDMAGSLTGWAHDYSIEDLSSNPAVDPWGATTSTGRVLRGGVNANAKTNDLSLPIPQ